MYDAIAVRGSAGALFLTSMATLFAACGTSGTIDPCTSPPTFTNDIFPMIIQPKCLGCHSQNVHGAARQMAPEGLDFDSYALVMPVEAMVADAITSGKEPPPSGNQITATTMSERQLVSKWRTCGYKR